MKATNLQKQQLKILGIDFPPEITFYEALELLTLINSSKTNQLIYKKTKKKAA